MEKIFKQALLFLMNDQVNQEIDSKNMGLMLNVNGNDVRIFKRPGRTVITCNCKNGTRFNDSLCSHKISALMYCWKEKIWD